MTEWNPTDDELRVMADWKVPGDGVVVTAAGLARLVLRERERATEAEEREAEAFMHGAITPAGWCCSMHAERDRADKAEARADELAADLTCERNEKTEWRDSCNDWYAAFGRVTAVLDDVCRINGPISRREMADRVRDALSWPPAAPAHPFVPWKAGEGNGNCAAAWTEPRTHAVTHVYDVICNEPADDPIHGAPVAPAPLDTVERAVHRDDDDRVGNGTETGTGPAVRAVQQGAPPLRHPDLEDVTGTAPPAATWPDYSLPSRYDDPADRRHATFAPCINNEIALHIAGREPLFFDALDLLRVVSLAVLDGVYGPADLAATGARDYAREEIEHQTTRAEKAEAALGLILAVGFHPYVEPLPLEYGCAHPSAADGRLLLCGAPADAPVHQVPASVGPRDGEEECCALLPVLGLHSFACEAPQCHAEAPLSSNVGCQRTPGHEGNHLGLQTIEWDLTVEQIIDIAAQLAHTPLNPPGDDTADGQPATSPLPGGRMPPGSGPDGGDHDG